MLKPKNISIKKVTQSQQISDPKKSRNSRKSLKMPKRQHPLANPSPIHLMKQQTCPDSSQQKNHGDFIKYINGYLNQLDSGVNQFKYTHENEHYTDKNQMDKIKRKIYREKEINKNLQKNIVEFQRILLDRTDRLDKLEDVLRKIQNKENIKNIGNNTRLSQSKSRHKLYKRLQAQEVSSEFQNVRSDESESEVYQQHYNKYKQRRKTQIPSEIQRMISRTMAIRPQKYSRIKS